MEKITLNAEIREEKGKTAVKKIRAKGYIPAVCYRAGKSALSIKLNQKELFQVLHTKAGENVLINLIIKDEKKQKERSVIIKELQTEAIKGDFIHVDFNEISLTEKITVKVPVAAHGEAKAVKKDNGVVEHIIWELEIECLPTEIPEKLQVEIKDMNIGDVIHVKDIPLPAGIKVINDPDDVVLTAKPPAKEDMKEDELAEEGAAEPELIAKGKKPEEGEEDVSGEPAKEE